MRKVLLTALLLSALAAVAADKKPMPAPSVKVGDTAPDFTMPDQNGKDVSLHDFKGKKNVVLAYYIFAFTGG